MIVNNINSLILESNKNNNPDDILKITSKIKYDNFTDEEKYIVKTPSEILLKLKGVCYDIVELERKLFNEINYKFKTYFAYADLPVTDNPTHTFLIFEENKKYYWFESSWASYRAIHGPFNSYNQGISYVSNQLKSSSNWKNVFVKEYTEFNYKNMNLNQFGQYIIDNFK